MLEVQHQPGAGLIRADGDNRLGQTGALLQEPQANPHQFAKHDRGRPARPKADLQIVISRISGPGVDDIDLIPVQVRFLLEDAHDHILVNVLHGSVWILG